MIATILLIMVISLILMVIIPVLPGQFIIWLAAMGYGALAGWEKLGWGIVAVLTFGMAAAAVIDAIAGWWGAKKWGGATTKAILCGLGASLIGLIFFNAIGALVGVMVGICGYEYWQDKDWRRALKAGGGYMLGLLVSLVIRFFIALGMVGLFWAQVV